MPRNLRPLMGGMFWEGPGIDKEYIPGDFNLVNTGINDLMKLVNCCRR